MTVLGATAWANAKPFYDALNLAHDGDLPVEQFGVAHHKIDVRFPHYEAFWKYHVCPATQRPNGIGFLDDVDDTISLIAQRSYSVLAYVLESLDFLALVEAGDYGPRKRHAYITLMYAGNALQVFSELQFAICGPPAKLHGKTTLADHLGRQIEPFLDWAANWGPRREQIVAYRNYLTHQGWFYSVEKGNGVEPLVLKGDCVTRDAFTWTDADRDYDADPTKWVKLSAACRKIVDESLAWLNDAYEELRKVTDPLLTEEDYQKLWGWKAGTPAPPLVKATQPNSTATVISRGTTGSSIRMTGSTASRVEPSPPASSGPPGSGVRQQ